MTLGKRDSIEFLAQYQSQNLSQIGTVLVDEQAEVGLRGFAFVFDRLAKASTFVFNANSFDLRLGGLLLVVVVLFVDQICDQLIQAMRNSDPRVSIVFVYKFKTEFPLHIDLVSSWL